MQEKLVCKTPVGNLTLTTSNDRLTGCYWTAEKETSTQNALLDEAQNQLMHYFNGKLQKFDIPLLMTGTTFELSVWKTLLTIPFGTTCSYQKIAEMIGNPKAIRAVGNANGKNALCIFVPCHRVIYASGKIGGYSPGLGYKEKLLSLEGVKI